MAMTVEPTPRVEVQRVRRDGNRIIFVDNFGVHELRNCLSSIHKAVHKLGYSDLILDFSMCSSAWAPSMLATCSQVLKLRTENVSIQLVMPTDSKLAALFKNANWAHLLDPEEHPPSAFQGYKQVPATVFKTPGEQGAAVDSIMKVILGAMTGIERSDFSAIEWSLNEITDNVLLHAQTQEGGLVQVTTFERTRRRVEFVVSDCGVGIPKSLRSTHPELTSDTHALEQAIREGVTRDPKVGQGNGLYGSYQICRLGGGEFHLHSGWAHLHDSPRDGLTIRTDQVPVSGTLVFAQIDCSQPGLLQQALKFKGKPHVPVDFIETNITADDGNRLVFKMIEQSPSFGSRNAGEPVRNRLRNLIQMCPGKKIYVDFDGLHLISSSFADEVFGKLFIEMGPLQFSQKLEFQNISETVKSLVDRAIMQRAGGG